MTSKEIVKGKWIGLLYTILVINIILPVALFAQEKLYPETFPFGDITLLEGPFKHARDVNIQVLLKYDIDRLIQPYRKEAGLPEKGKRFSNWAGLDGHVGGHYLSALAMNYASTGNMECKSRMDYMLAELKECQDANSVKYPDWGKGYLGGVPNSKEIWSTFKNGDFAAYRATWVPWYNVHKMYAGLRDAWLYAESETAKTIFLKFCDWGIHITSSLSDAQMQNMLDMEHGGMNETFADAYQMTGNAKYLEAARRFSHKKLLDAWAAGEDNLDNMHANTQVPKAVGFYRIGSLAKDESYKRAGSFFWETVTHNRTLAFGGNSRREFFPSKAGSVDFVNEVEGPETCNSYNMLKLTEDLFRLNPSGSYMDYYERTLFNHILSTQHPEHGGYVYFTPARPRHYRVYSSPNEAMWCCVGSGMENHSKYSQFIYTHLNDSLFLNLFVPSVLEWKEKGISIRQETKFPFEEGTKLKVTNGSGHFTMKIRYPGWVSEGSLKVLVNGKPITFSSGKSTYISINRQWKKGDMVQITLPMKHTIEYLPNVPNYIAFMYGPIVLGAKTADGDLPGLIAGDGRWGHIAGGKRLPVDKAPIIIADEIPSVSKQLVPVAGKPLTFSFAGVKMENKTDLVLEPFFQIHDARYMMYWMALTNNQYRSYLDSLGLVEKKKLELASRTVDFVAPGEQQPEADHFMEKLNSNTGNRLDEFWRDARNEGYFSYKLATNGEVNLSLMLRFWGAEWGDRKFDIYIDEEKLVSVDNSNKWNLSQFVDDVFPIPESMLKNKSSVRVKIQAHKGSTAGAVYYIRLLKK